MRYPDSPDKEIERYQKGQTQSAWKDTTNGRYGS